MIYKIGESQVMTELAKRFSSFSNGFASNVLAECEQLAKKKSITDAINTAIDRMIRFHDSRGDNNAYRLKNE